MAKDILMPQMGYDMTQGTIVRWLKKPGDTVHKGDIVAEIETDKATVEIEAFDGGTLLRVVAEPGATVPVGQAIATLGEPGEKLPDVTPAAKAAPPSSAPPASPRRAAPPPSAPRAKPGARPAAGAPPARDGVHASPMARRLAAELGVDLSTVAGSGPEGRILSADVEAAAEGPPAESAAPTDAPAAAPAPGGAPAPEGSEDVELTRLRQTIGRRMAESKRSAPHFYVSVECNTAALLALRERLNRKKNATKVSVNDLLVKALALAVTEHPDVNAAFIGDRVRRFPRVDVGIAIATDNGLMSPAVLDCGAKPVTQISTETRDLAERARQGKLKPEEYGGGTVTLSNLGMFGVDQFLAIINPPQALIVSAGAAAERPVVAAGKVQVAPVMTLWAAADHRVLDGADVAKFMATLKGLVEAPAGLAK